MKQAMKSWTYQGQPTTLQEAVREELGVSNRAAKARIDARDVFVNGKRVWMARHAVGSGDRLQVLQREAGAGGGGEVEIPVVYEDKWLVAVNKPPGCLSDGAADSAEARLRRSLGLPTLRALHRLDRDTSGVLLLNRREAEREPYVEMFREKSVEKTYLALVRGVPAQRRFVITERLDGKEAVTQVRVRSSKGDYALLSCKIPTGRTHQIRRHLQMRDLLLVGDRTYGTRGVAPPAEREIPRQMLHAWRVGFPCPHSGRPVACEAPLPEDLAQALRRFQLRT